MGDRTGIEWTEATWNPVSGCTPVSPGCEHCYAARLAKRLPAVHGGPDGDNLASERVPFSTVLTHPDRLTVPLRWRKPRRIFVCSMGDLFHPDVPFEFVDDVFETMAACQRHTFQVLTKRPERMAEWFNGVRSRRPIPGKGVCTGGPPFCIGENCPDHEADVGYCGSPWPLPNVWLGVTAEDQQRADERIPTLLRCPAAVRFVSVEPMIGPVDLWAINDGSWYDHEGATRYNALTGAAWWGGTGDHGLGGGPRIDWIICGGESGPGARPMHPEWGRSLRDQCKAAGVPFLLKQRGEFVLSSEWTSDVIPRGAGRYMVNGTEWLRVGKRAAGRMLDGVTHDEYPGVDR